MNRFFSFALALLFVGGVAQADMIYLKDGFVLVGKVKRENTQEVDQENNIVITIPRGFFFVDDGARRHYFNPAQVQTVDEMHIAQEDTLRTTRAIIFPKHYTMPPVIEMIEVGDFDDKWDRTVKYRSTTKNVAVNQHLSILNSTFLRIDCTTNYRWNSYYMTREIGPDVLRKLLSGHAEFAEPPDLDAPTRIARRFRYARFFARAGFYNECDRELDRIERDFPKELDNVTKERTALRKLQVEQMCEEIGAGEKAGRTKWVLRQIDSVPEKLANPRVLAQLATIKNRVTGHDDKIKEVGTFLETLWSKLETPEDKKFFEDTLVVLKAELNTDTIDRFDTFLVQARQYDKQIKAKGKADVTANQLLSLAVSGWLLGNASGELKIDAAQRFWRGRQFISEYIKARPADRKDALAAYEKEVRDALSVDEMAQLLTLMPPPEAEEKPEVEIVKKNNGTCDYTLQLPSEYRHTRKYPVLIALHDGKEKPADMMKRFGEEATKHGYILVAPDWGNRDEIYKYTTQEHACVLDTILDLRRKYQVDSDRIFMFGLGQGGKMAYDVGLSHPDLFAGVLPMSTCPEYYSKRYWANAQYLPFYVVGGDQSGDNNIKTREQFDKWMPHGYPSHFVQYKGRSNEWFAAEVPSMFDWMNRKKRFYPLTHMGRYGSTSDLGDMFATHRQTDNRFYWISTDSIRTGQTEFKNSPATVYARIDVAENAIRLNHFGFQQMTVWLARTGQIDFDKPVKVSVGVKDVIVGARLKPKLSTLLEDFANRLDRERLFVAKIDLKS